MGGIPHSFVARGRIVEADVRDYLLLFAKKISMKTNATGFGAALRRVRI